MAWLEINVTIRLITFKYIVHVRLDTDEYLLVRLRVGFSNANREKRGSRNFLASLPSRGENGNSIKGSNIYYLGMEDGDFDRDFHFYTHKTRSSQEESKGTPSRDLIFITWGWWSTSGFLSFHISIETFTFYSHKILNKCKGNKYTFDMP